MGAESNRTAAVVRPDGYSGTTSGSERATPRVVLGRLDVVAIIIGLVIGAGIFKTPSLVAANVGTEWMLVAAWVLGGVISLAGALCYGELAGAYPHTGGEYHFLTRAYGKRLAFLFAWSRLTVLQTGSIALLAFVLGDYMSELVPLGEFGTSIYAAASVVILTVLNLVGLRASTAIQRAATLLTVLGLLLFIAIGLLYSQPAAPAASAAAADPVAPAFGLAMVFVLLTYGGWNEAAYVSAELRDARRNMARVLVTGIVCITVIYVLANVAYLNVLGLEGMRGSQVVTADAIRVAVGDVGVPLVALLIVVAALTSINVSILTGARTNYAMATDFPLFGFLRGWNGDTNAPTRALLIQGGITLLLVLIGALSRSGFQTMVEYVSPVFWFFFLLTALSLLVLRRREPQQARPFRVPLYPLTPLVFAGSCAYMLYSSLAYTGLGAIVGVVVLAAGAPLIFFLNYNPAIRK